MTMQTHVTFSITENAKRRIVSLTKEYEAKIKEDAIAAIVWLDSDLNNGIIMDSQPVIGFYHDRSEVEGDIRTVDGLQIVLAIPDHEDVRFQGKSLDYENDRFILK
jgi:hypothetical protein